MCDLAKQKKVLACGRRRRRHRQRRPGHRASSTPGRAPTARSTGCRPRSASRAVLWYDQANFKATGDQMPTTLDEMLALTDQLKSPGQGAVVHRRGVRPGHRLADHRLDRGPGPAAGRPGELRQVGDRGAEVQQPGDQAGVRVLPEDRLHRRQRPRWHQVDRRDELPDRRQRAVRQPARLLPVQAGDLRRRQGWLPGLGARQPRHDGRRVPLPAEDASATTSSSVVATSPRRSTTTPTPSSCATSSPARTTESTPA